MVYEKSVDLSNIIVCIFYVTLEKSNNGDEVDANRNNVSQIRPICFPDDSSSCHSLFSENSQFLVFPFSSPLSHEDDYSK